MLVGKRQPTSAVSRGDTIIEVLIALAIVSSVLGSVFVLANRTSQNSRQTQEHQEALKYASSQLELLNEYLRQSGTTQPTGLSFCMRQDMLQPYAYSGGAPAQCQVDRGGYQYSMKLSYDVAHDVYTVTVTWPGATGGMDSVSLVYRTHAKNGAVSRARGFMQTVASTLSLMGQTAGYNAVAY